MSRPKAARRWQRMTEDERAAFVAAVVRTSTAAQGLPEFVSDPVQLEPAVRAVLEAQRDAMGSGAAAS